MQEGRLAGKRVLISGGASGIGLATAQRFAQLGAIVTIGDIDNAAADRATDETPGLFAVPLDVTDAASWAHAVDAVVDRYGGLDVAINNAGIIAMGDVESISLEDWHRVQKVNVDGVFYGCRHAVRAMKTTGGGSIVNLSSVSGLIGSHNLVAYNASKGAVRLLTKSVALHCARKKYNIRCNSVHPAFVETPMYESIVGASRDADATRSALAAAVPLGRVGTAREIADMLAYLASDESAFVTGAEFVIDGGLTAQ